MSGLNSKKVEKARAPRVQGKISSCLPNVVFNLEQIVNDLWFELGEERTVYRSKFRDLIQKAEEAHDFAKRLNEHRKQLQ